MRLTAVTYPARTTTGALSSETVRTVWNEFGQAIAMEAIDGSGSTTRPYVEDVDYDIYGKLRRIQYGNGIKDYWKYDTPIENTRLRCIRTTSDSDDSGASCQYNASADLQSLEYEDYDANGRILSIDDRRSAGPGLAAEWLNDQQAVYDPLGRLVGIDYSAGSFETFSYDALGNMSGRTSESGSVAYAYSTKHRHRLLQHGSDALDYDANGSRKEKGAWDYVPDSLGRIVEVGQGTGGAPVEQNVYDETGARVVRREGNLSPIHYHAGGLFETDEDELVRFFYLAGRLIATDRQPTPMGLWTGASADASIGGGAAIASVGAAGTGSAGEGRHRTSRVATNLRLASAERAGAAGLAVLLVMTALGAVFLVLVAPGARGRVAVAGAVVLVWTTLPLGPLAAPGGVAVLIGAAEAEAAVLASPDETNFIHTDHLGSTQVVTDETGAKVEELRYKAYGGLRCAGGSCGAGAAPNARRTFTGHVPDTDAGLIYMGARHYDPEVAGFLTFDPARQFASPYAYVGFDPLGAVDPNGEFAWFAALAAWAAANPLATTALIVSGLSLLHTWAEGGSTGDALLGAAILVGTVALAGPIGDVLVGVLGETGALAFSVASTGYGFYESAKAGSTSGMLASMLGAVALATGYVDAKASKRVTTAGHETSQSAAAPAASGGANHGGGFWRGVGDVLGKIWNLPNTIIGAAWGLAGMAVGAVGSLAWGALHVASLGTLGGFRWFGGGISFGNNAIQFTNSPLHFSGVATTVGNATIYGGGQATPANYGAHEAAHTIQGQWLGPAYLPAHILTRAAGAIASPFNSSTFGSAISGDINNPLEAGPYSKPPRPWR